MNAYDLQMRRLLDAEEVSSLTEKAFRLLRKKILLGEIIPGSKLKIDMLQREYNFSSSPLREALNRLAAEGLVSMDENRGFRVAQMSPEDLQDITTMRLIVEPAALADAMQAGSDEWEGRVIAAFHRMKRIEERVPRSKQYFDEDWTIRHKSFHMALFSACTSARLFMTCWNLFDQAERYRRFSANNRKEPRNTAGEHKAIMEAAIARETEKACQLVRDHILRTTKDIQRLVDKKKK
jgi:GntR family carbon starvation induced transcriptional regulator